MSLTQLIYKNLLLGTFIASYILFSTACTSTNLPSFSGVRSTPVSAQSKSGTTPTPAPTLEAQIEALQSEVKDLETKVENAGDGFWDISIPLIIALITAAWGYKRFLDERDFNKYQENIKNMYSSEKEVLLSAIATLSFYKGRKRYSRDVTDIFLNRFYTELDYDVINALITELSQVRSKKDITYVSQRLLDINRNFIVQKAPTQERRKIIRKIYWDLEAKYLARLQIFESQNQIDSKELDLSLYQPEYLDEKRNEFLHYTDLLEYKLAWHKQMVSDALGMTLLQASRRRLTKRLTLTFYGNSLTYSQFYDTHIRQWIIRFTDFTSSSLQEVSTSKILIFSSYFEKCTIRRCAFRNGVISNVEFINTQLDTVTFENIKFESVYFIGVELNNCTFVNVEGLDPSLFYGCKSAESCKFDEDFDVLKINGTTTEDLLLDLENSSRSFFGKGLIRKAVNELDA